MMAMMYLRPNTRSTDHSRRGSRCQRRWLLLLLLLIGCNSSCHCLGLHHALNLQIGCSCRNGHGIKMLRIKLGEYTLLLQCTQTVKLLQALLGEHTILLLYQGGC